MIIVAILFIILGICIKNFKMYFLIAGYNTLSKKEQSKYKIEKIAVIFRNTMFGMALIIILGFVLSYFLQMPKIEFTSLIVAIIIGIPYLLIKSNSKSVKHKNGE